MPMRALKRLLAFLRLPVGVQLRALLVRLPRLVPQQVLRVTAPDGPYPFIVNLPSRRTRGVDIPVYVFLPSPPTPSSSPSTTTVGLPVHIDFHGGGFIMGGCLEQAPFCGLLARKTGRVVLSVDYRIGPLDRFPAAVEDAEDVLAAVLDAASPAGTILRRAIQRRSRSSSSYSSSYYSLDPARLSLSGFSSGGNLALNLALSVEDWPSLLPLTTAPVPLLLFYPSFDARQLPHERPRPAAFPAPAPSRSIYGRYLADLNPVLMPTYLPPAARAHPRASPGLAPVDALHERARVLLVLPEMDTLAHQSAVWVGKMRDAGWGEEGSRLVVEHVPGMMHGWTQFPTIALKEEAEREKWRVFGVALGFVRALDEAV